jgi:taurine dioxygenase
MLATSSPTVRPLTTAVGSEILGIDVAGADDDTVALVRSTFNQRGVVFFRDQNLSPDQFLAFARRFGELTSSPYNPLVEGYRELAEVRKEEQDTVNVGGGWHTDQAFREVPVMGTMLIARQLPESGGDTMFINMGAAYDALSDGLKQTLAGLKAVHSNAHVFGAKSDKKEQAKRRHMVNIEDAANEAVHPVVGRHPESGRTILYVNPTYTVQFENWTVRESEPLLRYLFEHLKRPEFACRFRWSPGSMAFWDNRQVLHYAVNDYHGESRLMHRVMVAGPFLQ